MAEIKLNSTNVRNIGDYKVFLTEMEKYLTGIKSKQEKIADGYKAHTKQMQATNEYFRYLTEQTVLFAQYMKLLSSAKIQSAQRDIMMRKIEETVPYVKEYITYMNDGGD